MDFNSENVEPRCAADDVDREWWYDQDIDYSDLPDDLSREEKIALRTQEGAPYLAKMREDQLRAKFYCLECPVLTACRQSGWQEGSHVWGALDASERYRILKSGDVRTVIRPLNKVGATTKSPTVKRFMAGESVAEVAEAIGITQAQVKEVLRQALVTRRVEREDEEGWRSQEQLPSLPEEMGRESYRIGRAVWSLLERDSA